MANDHLETENKYDVDPGFVMPDLKAVCLGAAVSGNAVVREPEACRLSATYFDTEDLRLAAHRVTLRRRTGGADAGWHLKLPVQAGTRQELQEPLGDATGPQAIPLRLAAAVAAITAGAALAPVAVLNTERTVRKLTTADGEILAEIADDLVTGQRTRLAGSEPVTWREIEVETSFPDLLEAAGKLLAEAGARPSGSQSKLSRLLTTP